MGKAGVNPEPKQPRERDLRRALLDAAVKFLLESGHAALSFRELARSVGVTTGAPYHHFRDRGDLLATLAGEGFCVLRTRLERAARGEPHMQDVPVALAHAYLRFGRKHKAYYQVMFLAEVMQPENLKHIEETAQACFNLLAASIQAAAEVPAKEARLRAVAVWSLLHGMITLGEGGPLHRELTPGLEEPLAKTATEHLVFGKS